MIFEPEFFAGFDVAVFEQVFEFHVVGRLLLALQQVANFGEQFLIFRWRRAAASSFLVRIIQPRNCLMHKNSTEATIRKLTTSARNFP